MNLVSLQSEWAEVWEMLEASQGELTPEVESALDRIQGRSLAALFSMQDVRENAQMAVSALKDKISDMKAKIERLERTDASMKRIQVAVLDASGQKTMENGVYRITLTQNPLRIEIDDEAQIPPRYQVAEIKISLADMAKIEAAGVRVRSAKISPDKKEIAELYKSSGVEVSGVSYIREPNVRVS